MKTTNILLGLIFITLVGLTGVIYMGQNKSQNTDSITYTSKQHEIHERSPEVMPFTMNATKHEFNKIPGGGHQKVYVTNPNDIKNIKLIQGHLMEIAEAFQQGDFSMPKQLHGSDMLGVAYLENNSNTFTVEYIENEIGADIMYISENQETIEAIHTWFDNQVHDHGDDIADENMDMENKEDSCKNVPEGHSAEMRKMHHGCTE